MWLSVYSALVVGDERVRLYPAMRPAKEVAVIEQRVTIAKELQQQESVVQQRPRPTLGEEEDDWHVLLDEAPKKSGTISSDEVFSRLSSHFVHCNLFNIF